jgi:hypothetical protein
MNLGSSCLWDNVLVTSNAPMPCNIPEEQRPEYGLFSHIVFMCGKNVAVFMTLLKYRVIQKDGLNFVSLYFKIRTSDKYDVNYI